VTEIDGYQKEIERLKAAIDSEEAKIKSAIARVWGEDEPAPAEA